MGRRPSNKATFSVSLLPSTTKFIYSLIERKQSKSVSDAIDQMAYLIYSGKLLPEKAIEARAKELFERWKREQKQAEKEAEEILNAEVSNDG